MTNLFSSIAKKCGYNVSIHTGVYIFNVENLWVGNNVSIHPMSYIDAVGAVVVSDIEKNNIIGGIPARLIKRRGV